MTLTRGRAGPLTEPTVKTLPAVVIGASIITGVGFILFRDFVWNYSPLFGWQGWTPTLKLLVATAIGGTMTILLLNYYEYNHKWEHGSITKQIDAIKATRNFK